MCETTVFNIIGWIVTVFLNLVIYFLSYQLERKNQDQVYQLVKRYQDQT
ncbi:MAG: hypothetical protein MRERV_17c013 [Mycoplasmataceae bacterium RV_VA103A]|nr:MAG: hypothetical protein MRERV_22c043 [Mycoplasmataceae bacterium RV_VA103A]KLL04577.1 MAG: hypothetical protein MRERV_17c013 [Mycoplasmataceae bacterium RV_VA103A]